MRRRRKIYVEDDPTGLSSAVRDFNGHHGPARLFYNRNSGTFFVYRYEMDVYFGDMCNGIDVVELYRKTSRTPDLKVSADELRLMEQEIVPYSAW